jgi:hypothetical protein
VNRRLVVLPDGSVERRQMDGLDPALVPVWMTVDTGQSA